jgi:hypothetical protein
MNYITLDIDKNRPANRPKKPPVSEWKSYVYVGLWAYWYSFKTLYLGKLIAGVLIVLSFVELAGPLTHLLPEQAIKVRFTIAGLLFVTAFLMILHHHLLQTRTDRYEQLVGSIMVLLEDEARSNAGYTKETVTNVLDALVFALEYKREPMLLSATVLKRLVTSDEAQEPFRIYAQDGHKSFKSHVPIHATDSAAGKVVETDQSRDEELLEKRNSDMKAGNVVAQTRNPRALLYVPSTKYIHGALIEREEMHDKRGSKQVFSKTHVIPSAFLAVDSCDDPDALQCLLCIQIPLEQAGNQAGSPRSCAVLCLSGRKTDCMGALDFAAIKVVAAHLAQIMKGG